MARVEYSPRQTQDKLTGATGSEETARNDVENEGKKEGVGNTRSRSQDPELVPHANVDLTTSRPKTPKFAGIVTELSKGGKSLSVSANSLRAGLGDWKCEHDICIRSGEASGACDAVQNGLVSAY